MFSVNDPFLYALSGVMVAFVVAQSAFFLVRAVRRARQLGIAGSVVRKTVLSSALFSIAPAVSILMGVITLSQFIGLPFPWLRLSVLGAVTYELPAASIARKDKRWGEIVMDSLFLGMVSAFVGMLFADIRSGLPGFVPLAVAAASALLMAVCGLLIKKCKWSWLEQYALPLCMLGAMALSLPLTALMR